MSHQSAPDKISIDSCLRSQAVSRLPFNANSKTRGNGSNRPRVHLKTARKEGIVEVQGKALLHCFHQRGTVLKKCFGPFVSLFSRLKHCHNSLSQSLLPLSHHLEGSY